MKLSLNAQFDKFKLMKGFEPTTSKLLNDQQSSYFNPTISFSLIPKLTSNQLFF